MLKNNNNAVIAKMVRRSFRGSRRRNVTVLLAVMFSSFLLFCVFTVGATFFEMKGTETIRFYGADYDAYLYGLTPEQQELCEADPDILYSGIEALAGYVVETEKDSTPDAALVWLDETSWEKMHAPGRTWMEGEYPKEANEVMVKREGLETCGLEGLKTGDTFTMTYHTSLGEFTGEFRISGMWAGYGTSDTLLVSKAFYDRSGEELSSVGSGRYMIDFRQKLMSRAQQEAFTESLNLEKQQTLFFTTEYENSVRVLAGILGIAGITCLCAYLLIYNIMYLSVSGNIRYYGQLQTIGMTGSQIRRMARVQMTCLSVLGTVGGMIAGTCVSFFLIPTVVKSMGARFGKNEEIRIVFHPVILLLTVLLVCLTMFFAGRRPARIAVNVSPVEALGYRPVHGRKKSHKTGKGGILWRLAKEQLAKDKKKAVVVILSLSTGLSLFLCMVTLLESQAARTIVANHMDMDLVLQNDTLKKEEREDRHQVMEEAFLAELKEKEALEEVHEVLCTEITVPWEPDFAEMWMEEFYAMWMLEPYEDGRKRYQEHPEEYSSFLTGIDDAEFSCLNSNLEDPVEEEAFLNGETCILYRNELEFTDGALRGKEITCADYADPDHTRTFTIGGLTDISYYSGILIGAAPTVIVSNRVLREFCEEPLIYKVGLRYRQEYDHEAEEEVLSMIRESAYPKDISRESKLEELERVKKAQGNMMEVGMGIVLILAFIGIMNYVNTLVGNIRSREVEISVMESIGMTGKQVRRMLVLEGLLFAGGSLCVTWTAGLGITYYLYQSMNYRDIPFQIPVLPVAGAMVFVLLVCAAVPLVSYWSMEKKGTVVERIRGVE